MKNSNTFGPSLLFGLLKQQEDLYLERLQWAIETAPFDPHLWQHKYKGTPLQILMEHAKKTCR